MDVWAYVRIDFLMCTLVRYITQLVCTMDDGTGQRTCVCSFVHAKYDYILYNNVSYYVLYNTMCCTIDGAGFDLGLAKKQWRNLKELLLHGTPDDAKQITIGEGSVLGGSEPSNTQICNLTNRKLQDATCNYPKLQGAEDGVGRIYEFSNVGHSVHLQAQKL